MHFDNKTKFIINYIEDDQEADFEKQNKALFPREILEPLYEKWKHEYPNAFSADHFFGFLLRQTK